jgi:hypothetical protein
VFNPGVLTHTGYQYSIHNVPCEMMLNDTLQFPFP